jgi:hypothetical protein
MKNRRLALVFVLFLLAACNNDFAGPKKIGSGKLATQQRAVGEFKAIEVAGPYDVIVTQGPQAVEVSGDDNLIGDIETIVQGDTLVVREVNQNGIRIGVRQVVTPIKVRVATPRIERIRIAGSGDIEMQAYHGDKLELDVDGSGDGRIAGSVGELVVRSAGSGDLDLTQLQAERAHATLSASGRVQFGQLTRELTADVSGSGDVGAARVQLERLSAVLTGSGGMELRGTARQATLETSGSGDLNACETALDEATVTMRGRGTVCVRGPLRRLRADIHGSGGLRAEGLQADSVQAAQTSRGELHLAGIARTLDLSNSGSGEFEGEDLRTATATVRSAGRGNIHVGSVGESLDLQSDSSGGFQTTLGGKRAKVVSTSRGAVTLNGETELLEARLSGSGELDAAALLTRRADVVVRGQGKATVNVRSKQPGQSRVVTVDRNGAHEAR